jgi:hypothetical protein
MLNFCRGATEVPSDLPQDAARPEELLALFDV